MTSLTREPLDFGHLLLEDSTKTNLNANILHKRVITAQDRMILIQSMYNLCSMKQLSLNIAPLASRLLDHYLSKGLPCRSREFELLGITCLNLACKFEGGPRLTFKLSPNKLKRVIQFEQQVFKSTDYSLSIPTYNQYGYALLFLWRGFSRNMLSGTLADNKEMVVEKCQSLVNKLSHCDFAFYLFCELMKFSLHALQGLDIYLDLLVFNAFFFILCLQGYQIKSRISQNQIANLFKTNHQLSVIIQKFSEFCKSCNYNLSTQIDDRSGVYLGRAYFCMIEEVQQKEKDSEISRIIDPNNPKWTYSDSGFIQKNYFSKNGNSIKAFLNAMGQPFEV